MEKMAQPKMNLIVRGARHVGLEVPDGADIRYTTVNTDLKYGPLEKSEHRPLFVVANMVNLTSQIEEFLDAGANAISADVQFSKNTGKALCLYHGFPADLGRAWWHKGVLADYLNFVDNMSIPGHHQYRGDFANVLWLNLRLEEIHPSTYHTCGEEFAYLLNKYAFKEESKLRVVFGLGSEVRFWPFMQGLHDVLFAASKDQIVKRIAVSVTGEETLTQILQDNNAYHFHLWVGTERSSLSSLVTSKQQANNGMQYRDSDDYSDVCKVFSGPHDWWCTVDPALQSGVDVILTNNPSRTMDMVMLPEFKHKYRLADSMDDPFEKLPSSRKIRNSKNHQSPSH